MGALREEDWRQLTDLLQNRNITRYLGGSLGRTDISSIQRKEATEIFKRRGIRTAVLTDDVVIRGMVTAVGWLGANVTAFSWADIGKGLQYLGVDPETEARAVVEMRKLRMDVEARLRKAM